MDCTRVFDEKTVIVNSSVSSGSLRPIVPAYTGRYDVADKVQRSHFSIQPGMFLSALPTYLPPHWSESVHPEGQIYFYRDAGLRIVTDSYLHTPAIAEKICDWAVEVERQANLKRLALSDNIELYLQLSGDDCNYYFVDRVSRTIFWLEECETSELGLHPAVSVSHLQLVLEAQYWSHIENFCMHFGGLPQKSIDDLILIFTHALSDTLTSQLSTFPYDAPACERFLSLLTSSRDKIHEGHVVTFVARLWGVIIYNRYETHYGQEQPRLSRDSSILIDEDDETQWSKPILSLVSLRTVEPYLRRLDALYVDRFVYGSDWDSFMSSCIKDWQQTVVGSIGLLLLHIFYFFLPLSPILAYISSAFSSLSLLTAVLLIHRHEELEKAGASAAHDYLEAVSSRRFKLQGVALAYSFPKSFFLWGLISFFSQWAVLLCQHIMFFHAACCIFVVLAVLVSFQFATSRVHLSRPSLWSSSEKGEASMV